MPDLPSPGTRVSLRYRQPAGSQPPLTDVVGYLESTGPQVRVRTKDGAVAEFSADDVVTVRVLTAVPVRNSQIRAVEHAAALAWPGSESRWLDGWLLRAGAEPDSAVGELANSAVPLEMNARLESLPQIVDWYADRGLTPWLALPDRLVRTPSGLRPELEVLTMVSTLTDAPGTTTDDVSLSPVGDGEAVLGSLAATATGRATVTSAPDGARWLGLWALRVADAERRRGQARRLITALLAWGIARGAGQAYVQVPADNSAGVGLARALGFSEQHRLRYFDARRVLERRV
ncbi:N-acetyltransferase family protein [Mycolicibacterium thermoresistibile]